MKHFFGSVMITMAVALTFCNCEKRDDLLGNWKNVSTLDARGRGGSSCFVIDGKAYIVAGSGYYKTIEYYLDTWQYDPETKSWTEFDAVPASKGRAYGVGFALNNKKGYYGTGYGKEGDLFKDFFEFDPSKDKGSQWVETDSFPGEPIYGALAFTIDSVIGYVGTGMTKALGTSNTFYSYNPEAAAGSKWEIVKNINPAKRFNGGVFILDSMAYIIGGTSNSRYVQDFERFNPSYEKGDYRWFKISMDLDDDYDYQLYHQRAVAFSINGRGYICCGSSSGLSAQSAVWEYIPFIGREQRGIWTKVASFEGSLRYSAVGFAYNEVGYVMCGQSGTGSTSYYDDVWSFDPTEDYDEKSYK